MKFNKKELPLVVVQEIINTRKSFRGLAKKFEDVFSEVKKENTVISFVDTDKKSTFFFDINNISLENGKIFYEITFAPKSKSSTQPMKTNGIFQYAFDYFNSWIKTIEEYNNHELNEEEKFMKDYEDEFFTDFEIIDEDANESPFAFDRQVAISAYLENLIIALESKKNIYQLEDIIEEAKDLKANIQNETKNGVAKKLSKIFAKLRKKSIELLKEVFKEARKELIKRAISGGLDEIGHFLP